MDEYLYNNSNTTQILEIIDLGLVCQAWSEEERNDYYEAIVNGMLAQFSETDMSKIDM